MSTEDDKLIRQAAESQPDAIAPHGWPHAHIAAIARRLVEIEEERERVEREAESRWERERDG